MREEVYDHKCDKLCKYEKYDGGECEKKEGSAPNSKLECHCFKMTDRGYKFRKNWFKWDKNLG